MLYTKSDTGEFIPISLEQVVPKDWDNHLVIVRVGTDEFQADDSEVEITIGSPPSTTATQEFVVTRSIPIITSFAII